MSETDNDRFTKKVVATGNGFNVRIPKDSATKLKLTKNSIVEVTLKVITR